MRVDWSALGVFVVTGTALTVVGAVVAVRADVVTGLGLMAGGLAVFLMLGGSFWFAHRLRERARRGRPAWATVISANDTGVWVNKQPRLRLELEMTPVDGSPPYRVTTRRVVGHSGLGSMRPGARLMVSVDRRRPKRFEFVDASLFAEIGGPAGAGTPDGAASPSHSGGAVLPPDTSTADDGLIDGAERVALLERLAALHRTGSITDDEFVRAKALLLDG